VTAFPKIKIEVPIWTALSMSGASKRPSLVPGKSENKLVHTESGIMLVTPVETEHHDIDVLVLAHQESTFDEHHSIEQTQGHSYTARPNFAHYASEHGAQVHHLANEDIPEAVAAYVGPLARDAIKSNGKFTIALSGGSMPKVLGAALPSIDTDWRKWHVFFADERCVELTHDDSNYKACREHFLSKVAIPDAQVYKIDPALPPDEAAVAYTAHLTAVFGDTPEAMPSFDLMMLGMGPDGHTASLFPGHELLEERGKVVAGISDSPKLPPCRITLTLPVLNNAKEVCFIATGSSKAALLPGVLLLHSTSELPCALVRPPRGALHWFVDDDATALLSAEGGEGLPRRRKVRGASMAV
jgi:6-phosphogluconolactonase